MHSARIFWCRNGESTAKAAFDNRDLWLRPMVASTLSVDEEGAERGELEEGGEGESRCGGRGLIAQNGGKTPQCRGDGKHLEQGPEQTPHGEIVLPDLGR